MTYSPNEPTMFRDKWGDLRTWVWVVAGLAAVALAVGGIAVGWNALSTKTEQHKSERGRGDAPRPVPEQIDGRPVDGITEFPDSFSNVATKCVWDGYRGFVTSRAGSSNSGHLVVVPDEDCDHVGTGPEYDADLFDEDH